MVRRCRDGARVAEHLHLVWLELPALRGFSTARGAAQRMGPLHRTRVRLLSPVRAQLEHAVLAELLARMAVCRPLGRCRRPQAGHLARDTRARCGALRAATQPRAGHVALPPGLSARLWF